MNCLTQKNHLGSEKFGFISSENVVKTLESKGLRLTDVIESKIRKNKDIRQGYQKHVMRFNTGYSNKEGNLQLLAINSHEGSHSLTFRLGFFRLVCSNGLIIGNDLIPQIKVNHTLKGLLKLDDAIEETMEYTKVAQNNIEIMGNKILTNDQIENLYHESLKLRLSEKYDDKLIPLFEVKRYQDNKKDLFTQFNIIQENIIRTGFHVQNKENNALKKIRAIKGLDSNIKLNNDLFNLALRIAC